MTELTDRGNRGPVFTPGPGRTLKPVRAALAVLALTVLVAGVFPVYVLEVLGGRSGRMYYQRRVVPGEQFSLVFIHSVTRRPVVEIYRINADNTLSIVEMDFDTNGPNLPAHPEGTTKWIIEPHRFRVVNYHTRLWEIPLFIGQVIANHRLVFGRQTVWLAKVAAPGADVKIRAARTSLLGFAWREGLMLWPYRKNRSE